MYDAEFAAMLQATGAAAEIQMRARQCQDFTIVKKPDHSSQPGHSAPELKE